MSCNQISPENSKLFVDLRTQFSLPVQEQGLLNSCTACALASAVQFLYKKYSLYFDGNNCVSDQASVMYIYYHMRLIEEKLPQNVPLTVDESVQSLLENGVCSDLLWPYPQTLDINLAEKLFSEKCYQQIEQAVANGLREQASQLKEIFAAKPSLWAVKQAQMHKHFTAKKLSVTQGLSELTRCLDGGLPFVFGLEQHPSFFVIPSDGKLAIPPSTDERLGGHVVICLGYDDIQQVFICRNSFGKHFGDHGDFYVPYEFMLGSYIDKDGTEVTNTFGHWCIDIDD